MQHMLPALKFKTPPYACILYEAMAVDTLHLHET